MGQFKSEKCNTVNMTAKAGEAQKWWENRETEGKGRAI